MMLLSNVSTASLAIVIAGVFAASVLRGFTGFGFGLAAARAQLTIVRTRHAARAE